MSRNMKGVASIGGPPFGKGQDCGGLAIHLHRGGSGSFPLPRLWAWGSWGVLLDQ